MSKPIFVRELTNTEKEFIESVIRSGKDYQIIRVRIVKYSNEGYMVSEITKMVNIHSNNVRKWINLFNIKGLEMLVHQNTGKKPRIKFDSDLKNKVVHIALSKPRELGQKFTNWSLSLLKRYLEEEKIIDGICIESLRQILLSNGIKLHKTKKWLHSNDPEYEKKKNDILSLYNNPPKDGIVLCFDEKGTITAKEYQGVCWSKEQVKARLHYKIKGKTELFATYNPKTQEAVLMFSQEKKLNKR